MKGIAHFMSGVAVATFFEKAVHDAINNQSFILLWGGIFGILPDTLDFKVGRFFEKNDVEIDPDPYDTDAQKIADAIAKAANEAYTKNKSVKVQLHTIKLGVSTWRRYSVLFDKKTNSVIVEVGPIVSTSQIPYPDTEPKEKKKRIGKAKLKGKLVQELQKPSVIDIMSGPSFRFTRKGDNLEVTFLPWHRTWSHSYTLGFALALIVGLLFGWLAGVISALAFAVHITEDLFGFMGGNLFWPFTKERTSGMQVIKASNPLGNFLIVYGCITIIVFNLNRFSPQPVLHISWYLYFLITFVIPAVILKLISRFFKIEDITQKDKVAEKIEEELAELEEDLSF